MASDRFGSRKRETAPARAVVSDRLVGWARDQGIPAVIARRAAYPFGRRAVPSKCHPGLFAAAC